jgi:hypothetical protein
MVTSIWRAGLGAVESNHSDYPVLTSSPAFGADLLDERRPTRNNTVAQRLDKRW